MKTRILLICFCVLFAGCNSPKKIVSSTTENIKTSEKQNEVSSTESYSFVDTTKKDNVEINYYKIEFYPPDMIPDTTPEPDNVFNSVTKSPNAAVKSIESYTVKTNTQQSGVNEEKSNTTTNKDLETNTDISQSETITEQPAADPYRWRYIFGIIVTSVLLIIIAYFGLRKTKFISCAITFLKKMF
ncbi:MAG: hypothetical protein LBG80_00490 [Bacteroidales bacterium]|jgi:hypothetical protein|nr:hypothetical protein [Bacteroidales bacterium]